MSTTMIVCLIIIGLCTVAIITSTILAKRAEKALEKAKATHFMELEPPRVRCLECKNFQKCVDIKSAKDGAIVCNKFSPDFNFFLSHPITEHDGVKYARWLPFCEDIFGYTEEFECTNCHNLSRMPVVDEHEICYFEYCPHCGMKMMYQIKE